MTREEWIREAQRQFSDPLPEWMTVLGDLCVRAANGENIAVASGRRMGRNFARKVTREVQRIEAQRARWGPVEDAEFREIEKGGG